MFKQRGRFASQAGVSLVGAMIAGPIIAAAAFALGQVLLNYQRGMKSAEFAQTRNDLFSQIQRTLRDDSAVFTTLNSSSAAANVGVGKLIDDYAKCSSDANGLSDCVPRSYEARTKYTLYSMAGIPASSTTLSNDRYTVNGVKCNATQISACDDGNIATACECPLIVETFYQITCPAPRLPVVIMPPIVMNPGFPTPGPIATPTPTPAPVGCTKAYNFALYGAVRQDPNVTLKGYQTLGERVTAPRYLISNGNVVGVMPEEEPLNHTVIANHTLNNLSPTCTFQVNGNSSRTFEQLGTGYSKIGDWNTNTIGTVYDLGSPGSCGALNNDQRICTTGGCTQRNYGSPTAPTALYLVSSLRAGFSNTQQIYSTTNTGYQTCLNACVHVIEANQPQCITNCETSYPESTTTIENWLRPKVSRCSVCMIPGPINVVHGNAAEVPTCPTGWDSLWSGYSLLGGAFQRASGGMIFEVDKESPGSCVRNYIDIPFMGTMAFRAGSETTSWGSSPDSMNASRCNVCYKPASQ